MLWSSKLYPACTSIPWPEKLYSRLAGNHCCKSRVATGTVFLQRVGKYNIKVLSRRRLIDCDQNTHRSHRTVSVQKLGVLLLCYQYSRWEGSKKSRVFSTNGCLRFKFNQKGFDVLKVISIAIKWFVSEFAVTAKKLHFSLREVQLGFSTRHLSW